MSLELRNEVSQIILQKFVFQKKFGFVFLKRMWYQIDEFVRVKNKVRMGGSLLFRKRRVID
jgi:hypothetical protein